MSDLSIANIDTSNMNPGENGAPDQITVRVNIKSSIHGWPSLSQGVGVTVLLEPGTIKKDFGCSIRCSERSFSHLGCTGTEPENINSATISWSTPLTSGDLRRLASSSFGDEEEV